MSRTTVFLAGDVMLGRGVDQILAHPGDPRLHERFLEDAREYVELAERASGPIPRGVGPRYVWGDVLEELDRSAPDARVVNLETAVTSDGEAEHGKGIHYRMHPRNVDCLTAAKIDVAVLANNHVLDWGPRGLIDTLETLGVAGIQVAGAGRSSREAELPAAIGRVLVCGVGTDSSGIPASWAAAADRPGVARSDLSDGAADAIAARVQGAELGVVSIHWGGNWGFDVPASHVRFAHRLVDAGVHVVHGHSSHHVRPIEIYRDRLILYGCGDLINDYEGIGGYEEYRGDLSVLYFATFDGGRLAALRMVPMQIRKLSLHRTSADWLASTLEAISADLGTRIERLADGSMMAHGRQGS
jgi:poly-gamma-glutamate synthesis protein (capsule biosynthesis protein)